MLDEATGDAAACEALSALSSCVSKLGLALSPLSPEERELLLEYYCGEEEQGFEL